MLHTLFIADLHLLRLLSLLPNNFSETEGLALQLSAVRKILQYARSRGIKYVIQLGDVFHIATPTQTAVVALLSILSEFPDVHIFFIPGNHDYQTIGQHSQQIIAHIGNTIKGSNITVFDKPAVIKLGGVPIYFCPWPYHGAPTTPHLCIGHFDINGLRYANGTTVIHKIARESLGRHNLWVMGHNHTPQFNGNIFNPGTPYQVYSNEHHHKKVLELMVDYQNGALRHKPIWHNFVPPYILRPIEYNKEEDLQQIVNIPNTFWLITVGPQAPPLSSKWLVEHPNIISRPARTKSKIQTQSLTTKQIMPGFSPLFMLDNFLKDRGLSAAKIAEGYAIISNILQNLRSGDSG